MERLAKTLILGLFWLIIFCSLFVQNSLAEPIEITIEYEETQPPIIPPIETNLPITTIIIAILIVIVLIGIFLLFRKKSSNKPPEENIPQEE